MLIVFQHTFHQLVFADKPPINPTLKISNPHLFEQKFHLPMKEDNQFVSSSDLVLLNNLHRPLPCFSFLRIQSGLPRDYNCFFQLPPIFPAIEVLWQYSQMTLVFLVEIFMSHPLLAWILLLLYSKILDPLKKFGGKFDLSSSFFGVGWQSVDIITKDVYWYVEQVKCLHPVQTEEVLQSIHDECI